MKNVYAIIGENVLRARKARGMKQEDLATAVGFLRTSVANIEAGKQRVPLHTLEKIAAALDVSPGELLPATWWPQSEAAATWRAEQRLADVRVMLQEIIEELE